MQDTEFFKQKHRELFHARHFEKILCLMATSYNKHIAKIGERMRTMQQTTETFKAIAIDKFKKATLNLSQKKGKNYSYDMLSNGVICFASK